MKTLNELFSAFKLKRSEVNKISALLKKAATTGNDAQLSHTTRSLLIDIFDRVTIAESRVARNVSLLFQLFEVFPGTHRFIDALYYDISDHTITDIVQKEIIWKQLLKYLSAEDCYSNPVKDLLRYSFFNDENTTKEAWQGIMNARPDKKVMLDLLELSTCVPWDVKEKTYQDLLADKSYHPAIFKSIYSCAFEKDGKIDRNKAFTLLQKLSIDRRDFKYRYLSQKINSKK